MPWDRLPAPAWPGGWNLDNTLWNRDTLAAFFRPFADLAALGAQVHCGEIGCYNRTPHPVTLAWLDDALGFFTENGIGFALWQLEGNYGLVNSGRDDVDYLTMPDGRLLDQEMLKLLEKY